MFVYGELVKAILEKLASNPATTVKGRIFYDTALDVVKWYDGGWKTAADTSTAQVITTKTLSRASNTLSGYTAHAVPTADASGFLTAGVAPSTAGNVLQSDGTDWVSATPSAAPDSAYELSNLALSVTQSGGDITVALKDKSGATPSAGSQVKIGFRNATATAGTYDQVSISAANTLSIVGASTLGSTSGTAITGYIYAVNNGGTVTLAVSRLLFDENSVQTTTTTATNGTNLYQPVALSNKPIRLLGRFTATNTTSAWASPTEVAVRTFAWKYKDPTIDVLTSGSSYVLPAGAQRLEVKMVGGGGSGSGGRETTGGTSGSSGDNTTFGNATANGGGLGTFGGNGGLGGGYNLGGYVGFGAYGGDGGGPAATGTVTYAAGGTGGSSVWGGGGSRGANAQNSPGTGAGGAGGVTNTSGSGFPGSGGGAGGYAEFLITGSDLATSFSYGVAGAKTGGAAGSGGSQGGGGESGQIVVKVHYY